MIDTSQGEIGDPNDISVPPASMIMMVIIMSLSLMVSITMEVLEVHMQVLVNPLNKYGEGTVARAQSISQHVDAGQFNVPP